MAREPKLRYLVTMYNADGDLTYSQQFPTLDSMIPVTKLSKSTIRRILSGTSTQNFLKIDKLSLISEN